MTGEGGSGRGGDMETRTMARESEDYDGEKCLHGA